jgi:hypothetical protein
MDPISSLPEREELCALLVSAIGKAQEACGEAALQRGAYYVDVKRQFMPLLD